MKPKIMFVDNAANVLDILKWIFKKEPYSLFAFENPLDALNYMRHTKFSAVLVDHYMPEMSGIEFLRVAKKISPDTPGIIMTSLVDLETKWDFSENGLVYRFISKPWQKEELKEVIQRAVALYQDKRSADKR